MWLKRFAKLKQEPGNALLQYGVGELTQTMLQHSLVDELRLVVFPFTFGRGQHLFDGFDLTSWQLSETKTFSSGAIALHYQPQ
jgi:dihydrofolate reductase